MKKEIERLDATPSKRLYLSIIADYDLNKSICELIDNGVDVWVRSGKTKKINIKIELDKIQQRISVEDNAGGLAKSELRYIVGPGQTGTDPKDEVIGIFGVGTKRAVVALAQDIKIRTRYEKEKTYQVDFDDKWIEDDNWELPVYEVDEIIEGTTLVELQRLRVQLTDELIIKLKDHLQSTYTKFLAKKSLILKLNGEELSPKFFENWAYPPKYHPQKYTGVLKMDEGHEIRVAATAGLCRESSPAAGEYGVYFYCNDRLIARALKTFDVGFTKGIAGLPHPKVSLTRVLVSLNGEARFMPWNSSKSDLNINHEVFIALRNWLVQVVKYYASLSRIWMGDWPNKVFKYSSGTINEIKIANFPEVMKSFPIPLPHSRPRYGERVALINKEVSKRKPWSRGIYEGIIAADLIASQRLEQKNRVALIVLDSTLEIAFKEYLVNETGTIYNDAKLLTIFSTRSSVHSEIKKSKRFKKEIWRKIEYYYRLRCKLVHERITVGISDDQIKDFRGVVENILYKLFKLKFD